MSVALLFLALTGAFWVQAQASLKLASYYSDHMVLQRGPQQSVLWGTADTEGDTVTAQVKGHDAVTTTVQNGKWKLKLPAITDPGPFAIDVSSKDGHVTLHDVLFGDVWVCSGQSNMQFAMRQVMNSTAEIQKGLSFNTIRFLGARLVQSPTLLEDLNVSQTWTAPTKTSLGRFSAVCFLFAEYLQPHLNYPIGLVGTYWGGTTIEAWSPPEAAAACPTPPVRHEGEKCGSSSGVRLPNAGHGERVEAAVPPAVSGRVPPGFPLWLCAGGASSRSAEQTHEIGDTTNVGGFPALRWAQTANHGYSPNPDLPNTFMAVAMDLPDVHSPYGAIHPRYKQEVADRLVRGALHVAYGQQHVQFQGPFPSAFLPSAASQSLTVKYQPETVTNLTLRNTQGFEVCCGLQMTCNPYAQWVKAPIIGHAQSHVTLDVSGCHSHGRVSGIRYEWHQTPCPLRHCAVYDAVSGLPAPPFLHNITAGSIIG